MTQNQIRYAEHRETQRHDLAQEIETNRANLARETETHRSNVANETETNRHNMAMETETNRHNKQTEAVAWYSAEEQARHNRETEAAQKRQDALRQAELLEQQRHNEAMEYETNRHNKQDEAIAKTANQTAAVNADANQKQADAAAKNAESNAKNAETNAINAQTRIDELEETKRSNKWNQNFKTADLIVDSILTVGKMATDVVTSNPDLLEGVAAFLLL